MSDKTPTRPGRGGRRPNQTGRPRNPTKHYRVTRGTPEQMAIIDALTPDERLERLTASAAGPDDDRL